MEEIGPSAEGPMLFDGSDRTGTRGARYGEPHFAYLNVSGRDDVARIRETLSAWFLRYPAKEQAGLRGRLISPDDAQHESALFELSLHEMFRRMGFDPAVDSTTGVARPDFLLTTPDGPVFVEATVAIGQSPRNVARETRKNVVYDMIQKVESPNFFIGIRGRGGPRTPPRASDLCRRLERWLAGLDPAAEAAQREGGVKALPGYAYEHDGWGVTFYAIPKSRKGRAKPGVRPIGIRSEGMTMGASHLAARQAIIGKAGRYGDLGGLPLVVAVNVPSRAFDPSAAVEALFGTEQVVATLDEAGDIETTPSRARDGVWTEGGTPIRTRVSAVLFAHQLSPWTLASVPLRLYLNPWAARSCPEALKSLPYAEAREGRLVYVDGAPSSQLWGLPEDWPGQTS
jgi:hypothetical protein